MSAANQWQQFRAGLVHLPALDFSLDLSRMDLPADLLSSKAKDIAAALDAMDALEKGAIANPDEQRMVGHYWLRDSSLAPTPALRAAVDTTRDNILAFAKDVHEGKLRPEKADRFENVLVVGIGGSALGPQFVASALTKGPSKDPMRVFFFDNTDPDGMDKVLTSIPDLARTLTVVISKSGGTKETRNGMLEARRAWEKAGLSFAKHAVAVTGDNSELDKYAKSNGWLATFPMFDWIGGRTSELSAVGLLPAALQGLDVRAMLDGARAMDQHTRSTNPSKNPGLLLALAWLVATNGKGEKDMVLLPYKDRLELFSRYLQQLVMESLGKDKDLQGRLVHQGIAVYGNKGSTDQHAYVQQLRDGVHNFFVTFIEVLHDRDGDAFEVEPGATSGEYLFGFLEGTRKALYDAGRKSITITIPRADAHGVGMLIALYERAVGFYASLVGINAYHQPGVEAGKKAAAAVLSLQAKVLTAVRSSKEARTAEQIAQAAGTDDVETTFKLLRHLSFNPGRGVRCEAKHEDPSQWRFSAG